MAIHFVITDHALERFVERHGKIDPLDPNQCRRILLDELAHGVLFGGQVGNGALYLLPCGLVAAVVRNQGTEFVKTILTREHAIANMESQGAILGTVPGLYHKLRQSPAASNKPLDSEQKAELRALAEQHFRAGTNIRERNAALRERGYDRGGEAGNFYRAAYQAAVQMHLAWTIFSQHSS